MTTPTEVVVSSVEQEILITLEELAKAVENEEETHFFHEGEEVNNILLGSGSNGGNRGEGNGGGEGRDEPIDSEVEPSDSK